MFLTAVASAGEPRTRVVSQDGIGKVVAGETQVTLELPPGASGQTCQTEPQLTVTDEGKSRPVFTRLPAKTGYIYRGKRGGYGMCDVVTCQPVGNVTLPLREYRETGRDASGTPIFALAPLSGRVEITLAYFTDGACSVPAKLHAVVEHHPGPDEQIVEDDVFVAAAAKAGLANAEVLARHPDRDTGKLALVAGVRDGKRELDLVGPGDATPLVVARSESKAANLAPFAGAADLVDVWVRESHDRDSATTHHVVRLGAKPVEVCRFEQADVTVKGGLVTYQELFFEPREGPGFAFDVVYQESLAGQSATSRRERWRLGEGGCEKVK